MILVDEAGAHSGGTEVAAGLYADNTRPTDMAAGIGVFSPSKIQFIWGWGLFEKGFFKN